MTATGNGLTDEAFIAAFESGSLGADQFQHADHVRIGYLYLTRCDFGEALHRDGLGIRRHAAAHGQPDKYHETITVAFLAVMNERLAAEDAAAATTEDNWSAFAAANPDLFDKGLMLRYYTPEELASTRARQVFLFSRTAASCGPRRAARPS